MYKVIAFLHNILISFDNQIITFTLNLYNNNTERIIPFLQHYNHKNGEKELTQTLSY